MKNSSLIPFLFLLLVFLPSIALSECIEGNCQNGQGTYSYADGLQYKGEWKKGMRHGLGKVIDEKGIESKNGYWKNGSFKGGKP